MSYLRTYGNTKESDLIEYGIRISSLPTDNLKNVLERMVLEGRVKRVIHEKLELKPIYITCENCWAFHLEKTTQVLEEVGSILNEAAALAEKRIREKFPEDFRKSRRASQERKKDSKTNGYRWVTKSDFHRILLY